MEDSSVDENFDANNGGGGGGGDLMMMTSSETTVTRMTTISKTVRTTKMWTTRTKTIGRQQ